MLNSNMYIIYHICKSYSYMISIYACILPPPPSDTHTFFLSHQIIHCVIQNVSHITAFMLSSTKTKHTAYKYRDMKLCIQHHIWICGPLLAPCHISIFLIWGSGQSTSIMLEYTPTQTPILSQPTPSNIYHCLAFSMIYLEINNLQPGLTDIPL